VRGAEILAEEREIISRELAADRSLRSIGRLLGRDHTVVSREVARNGGRVAYRAMAAQQRADDNRARPKPRLLETNTRLHDAINDGLKRKWPPKQISKRLRQDFPADDTMRVSHETIYECLYLQARGALRTQLTLALRPGRTRRVSRSRATVARGTIPGMITISERPVEAADRAVPGFGEGDLMIGQGGTSQIATLVQRASRSVMLVRIPDDRTAERVAALLAQKMETLPEFLRTSITWDQGRRWRRTRSSPSRPESTSISVIRTRPGSGAVTRTPTGYCASTSPKERTSRATRKPNSTLSPTNSTTVHVRHSAGRNRPKFSTNSWSRQVVHSPLDTALLHRKP
jgi:IS30 family transposase